MRHPAHDYSLAGGYFVTFNTQGRRPLLGSITNGTLVLSQAGKIVRQHWEKLPTHFPRVQLDAFAIMPDHVHCIIVLVDPKVAGLGCTRTHSLPDVMRGFKLFSAKEINQNQGTTGKKVWQADYIDRVIRSDKELDKFRYYIETNVIREALESGK